MTKFRSKRLGHDWGEMGQTYTLDTPTLIYWCRLCGTLKFSRTAGDYKEWVVRPKKGNGCGDKKT